MKDLKEQFGGKKGGDVPDFVKDEEEEDHDVKVESEEEEEEEEVSSEVEVHSVYSEVQQNLEQSSSSPPQTSPIPQNPNLKNGKISPTLLTAAKLEELNVLRAAARRASQRLSVDMAERVRGMKKSEGVYRKEESEEEVRKFTCGARGTR